MEISKEDLEKFKELEEQHTEEKSTIDSKGNFSYKEFAKKYNPKELTPEFIKNFVDIQFPLLGKDVSQDERTKRSKYRNKLKSALQDRAKEVVQEQQRVEVKEEKVEEVREDGFNRDGLISKIVELQQAFALEDGYSKDELDQFTDQDLKGYFANLQRQCLNQVNSNDAEFLFSMLLLGARVGEGVGSAYGYDFTGVTQKHMEQKENLIRILGDVLEENPSLRQIVTPTMQLVLTVGDIYGSALYENTLKKK